MLKKQIELDFGTVALDAELFDTAIAERFAEKLPLMVDLTRWGNELYGPIASDLGEEDPVSAIPPGGIAYTNHGNYVCIFFGQTPAWPVEYIGHINGDQWRCLGKNPGNDSVTIKAKQ